MGDIGGDAGHLPQIAQRLQKLGPFGIADGYAHTPALFDQLSDQMATDEAGPAKDRDKTFGHSS
ncbi:hypothetical protein GCM10027256_06570 [Novispirillum itersonii subsp. nipponicum]